MHEAKKLCHWRNIFRANKVTPICKKKVTPKCSRLLFHNNIFKVISSEFIFSMSEFGDSSFSIDAIPTVPNPNPYPKREKIHPTVTAVSSTLKSLASSNHRAAFIPKRCNFRVEQTVG